MNMSGSEDHVSGQNIPEPMILEQTSIENIRCKECKKTIQIQNDAKSVQCPTCRKIIQIVECDKCGAKVSANLAFYMYNFKTCSVACSEPLRQAKQDEENAKRPKRDKYHGAFAFQYGGAC